MFLRIILLLMMFFNIAEAKMNTTDKVSTVGIIIPMEEESRYLKTVIKDQKIEKINHIKYISGKLHNKDVVLAMSGLGKINASIVATRLIRDFNPDLILIFGSSGGISSRLNKKEVVIGGNVINVDLGELTESGVKFQYEKYLYSPQKEESLPLSFKLNDNLVKIAQELNKKNKDIILGSIATSDALPNSPSQVKLMKSSGIDVIEMEGAAVMQTCWMFDIPCAVIRGVSNNPDEKITPEDMETAGTNAAKVVEDLLRIF